MATSTYTSLLAKDYRRKLGDIILLRKDLKDLCQLIRQREVEAEALKTILFGRDGAPPLESLKPIRSMPRVTSLKHATLTRTILDCLRTAKGGVVRKDQIIQWVVEAKNVDVTDRARWVYIGVAVQYALKRLAAKGTVTRHHDRGSNQFGYWSIPNPTVSSEGR